MLVKSYNMPNTGSFGLRWNTACCAVEASASCKKVIVGLFKEYWFTRPIKVVGEKDIVDIIDSEYVRVYRIKISERG